jgi:signal transduction histidine kinase/HAMP domain-containing protein
LKQLTGSLRFRLAALAFAAVTPAMALALFAGIEARRSSAASAREEALRISRLVAGNQEALIQAARGLISAFTHFDRFRPQRAAECNLLAPELAQDFPSFTAIAVAFPDGNVYCSSSPLEEPVNLGDRPYFQEALRKGDFAVGEYVIGRITGLPILPLAQPILDDQGLPIAVVVAPISLEWLSQLLSEMRVPEGMSILVIDRNGMILARYPDPEGWVGQTVPDHPVAQAILEGEAEGTREGVGVDGQSRLYGFTTLSDASVGGYVSVGIPTSTAYADANRTLARNLVLLGVVLALALGVSQFASTGMVLRPVRGMLDATRRMAQGDLTARTGVPRDQGELPELAQAFDEMAGKLESRSTELEATNRDLRRVNRALRALSECSQALVRHTREEALLHDICRIMVEVGGYRMAWVGFAQEDQGEAVIPVAQAGFEDGYLEQAKITWANVERGRGITGTAIRTGQVAVVHEILTDPASGPWREEALRRGYASSIAVPLKQNGSAFGALNIYASEAKSFDENEIALLEEMADDLAYGLQSLRAREAREAAETALRRSAERLSNLHRIDQSILAAGSLEAIAQAAVAEVRRMTSAVRAGLVLNDLDSEEGVILAGDVPGDTSIRPGLRLPLTAFDPEGVLRRGEVYHVTDLATQGQGGLLPDALLAEGVRETIRVPLMAEGRLLGSLSVGGEKPGNFGEETVNILREVADQLAVALRQAQLHDQVRQHAEELEERVRRRTAELQEINAELEAFAHTVSHDLRAPLRAMQGFAVALLEDLGDRLGEKGIEYTRRIWGAAERMDRLILDLLAYSRLSRMELKLQQVDLGPLVAMAVDQLEGEIRETGAQVDVEGPLPDVLGQPEILLQVAQNLLSNALKFVAEGTAPQVRVWAEPRPGAVRLWVEDNGIGVAPSNHERIFHVFERLHGVEQYPGTGVGLAIVRKAAARLGGSSGLESEVGRGSRFWVELPAEGAGR